MVKIWDREAEDGKGGMVEMLAINSREAIKHDPKRYSAAEPAPEPKAKPKADDLDPFATETKPEAKPEKEAAGTNFKSKPPKGT